jgi:hypothetical protein
MDQADGFWSARQEISTPSFVVVAGCNSSESGQCPDGQSRRRSSQASSFDLVTNKSRTATRPTTEQNSEIRFGSAEK